MKLRALLLSALMLAAPVQAKELPEDHRQLLSTLTNDGVNIFINRPSQICGDGDIDGSYIAFENESYMAICQDNYDLGPDTDVVEWSHNDLDTIRHEVTHLIQDCKDGTNSDSVLSPIFDNPVDVIAQLGVPRAQAITETYRARGASDEVILLELEAFYAASHLSAGQIEELYVRYCR